MLPKSIVLGELMRGGAARTGHNLAPEPVTCVGGVGAINRHTRRQVPLLGECCHMLPKSIVAVHPPPIFTLMLCGPPSKKRAYSSSTWAANLGSNNIHVGLFEGCW